MMPLAVYQAALDTVSAAVLADDFAAYLAMLDLPYLICTVDTYLVLSSPAELEPSFRTLSRGLACNGVTHFERVAREASFHGTGRIVGRHCTHMIAGHDRIQPPHTAAAALVRREGDIWRFTEARYPLVAASWPLSEADIFGPALSRVPVEGLWA